ncbi:hypothetical protein PIB30_091578 [Stylosanthes scabra]|uniref:Uncharacterized protein n=1 Tax=Stylosanthes scabra TaxID=79078 RepID=A0ABU6QVY4_9FABA|nr:hypothetical protein [Stylosanthes scabra]
MASITPLTVSPPCPAFPPAVALHASVLIEVVLWCSSSIGPSLCSSRRVVPLLCRRHTPLLCRCPLVLHRNSSVPPSMSPVSTLSVRVSSPLSATLPALQLRRLCKTETPSLSLQFRRICNLTNMTRPVRMSENVGSGTGSSIGSVPRPPVSRRKNASGNRSDIG